LKDFKNIAVATVCLMTASLTGNAQEKRDTTAYRQIFESVEVMPEFPGGIIKMETFVVNNLRLPSLKDAPVISGVYTRFVINSDGSVSDIKIARSSGSKQVDDSVKAVISRMPLWKPGVLKGKLVNCYYNMPISCIKYK
jgi:protein TonB